jgi:hypothetical protein
LTPSKRLQNVKSSKKIDCIRRLRRCNIQPNKINPGPGHLFRFAKKVPRMDPSVRQARVGVGQQPDSYKSGREHS